jgi:hypothetical protein
MKQMESPSPPMFVKVFLGHICCRWMVVSSEEGMMLPFANELSERVPSHLGANGDVCSNATSTLRPVSNPEMY